MFSIVFAASLLFVPLTVRPIAPVSGPVIQRFVAPLCERCSGHRGVTIASSAGQPVRAVLPGVITFVGEVAGNTYVVEQIAPKAKVTYGWIELAGGIAEGAAVEQGQVVGTAEERMYLGVRIGAHYVEPLRFLGLGWARLQGVGGVVVGRTGSAR